jgi:oligosaccharyltransferase complex subunit alpha (ribophorin I)
MQNNPNQHITNLLEYRLPQNANVITFTETTENFSRNGNKLVYGPFTDIHPLIYTEFHVHYEQSKPILSVKNLVRDIHVSHLGGNLAVEERYPLQHEGARLVAMIFTLRYFSSRIDSAYLL